MTTDPAIAKLAAEELARLFHEAYERLAPSFGYATRRASAVPWHDVPEANRGLMIAVAGEILATLADPKLRAYAGLDPDPLIARAQDGDR